MNSKLVSIIIPVYNVEQYLRQCLDSVINQTFRNIEIIIINDCSTDNSLDIIKEYLKKDNRIVLINLIKNIGLGFARNEGLNIAKGKYITFVDSDDWISSNYIDILYKNIEQYNADFISANFFKYDNNTKKIIKNSENFYIDIFNKIITTKKDKKNFLVNNMSSMIVCGKIFNNKFVKYNNIKFTSKILEDSPFIWKSIIKSSKFVFINKPIYFYRLNRVDSISNKDLQNIKYFDNHFELFDTLKQVLHDTNTYEQYLLEYNRFIVNFMTNSLLVSKIPFPFLKTVFMHFKQEFYYNNFNVNYKNISVGRKFRMYIYLLCLKYNFNYVYFAVLEKYIKRFLFFKQI